jgi:hypothetical protein
MEIHGEHGTRNSVTDSLVILVPDSMGILVIKTGIRKESKTGIAEESGRGKWGILVPDFQRIPTTTFLE